MKLQIVSHLLLRFCAAFENHCVAVRIKKNNNPAQYYILIPWYVCAVQSMCLLSI